MTFNIVSIIASISNSCGECDMYVIALIVDKGVGVVVGLYGIEDRYYLTTLFSLFHYKIYNENRHTCPPIYLTIF